MIQAIKDFLNQFNLDVRQIGDARYMDQKCTPDVVCFIAECVMNLNPQGEFTVKDIWDMPYFVRNASVVFGKPSPQNASARHEYDKFIQQPLRMFAYAHVLGIDRRGNKNYYTIQNREILDYVATKERNAYNFLYVYITKVLADSDFLRYFEAYRAKAILGTATKADFKDVKDRFERFTIGNTRINKVTEVRRIFTKVFNIYCCENGIQGTQDGRQSRYPITFSDLMYNRVNWRDADKAKSQTRQEAATAEELQQQEAYDAYQVRRAVNKLKEIQIESEVRDQYGRGEATHVHHIFPRAEFPQIAHYMENLIKLTATQHFTMAHPGNDTHTINRDYQFVCLMAKSDTIERSLRQFGDKYYRKESFIVVINTGLDADLGTNLDFSQIRTQLRYLYNNI